MTKTTQNRELCLADAAMSMPAYCGRKLSSRTVERWIKVGLRGVKLEGWKRGGRWFTSTDALEEFKLACTLRNPSLAVPSKREMSSSVKRAMRELQVAGLC
jgi:hypothetical protein